MWIRYVAWLKRTSVTNCSTEKKRQQPAWDKSHSEVGLRQGARTGHHRGKRYVNALLFHAVSLSFFRHFVLLMLQGVWIVQSYNKSQVGRVPQTKACSAAASGVLTNVKKFVSHVSLSGAVRHYTSTDISELARFVALATVRKLWTSLHISDSGANNSAAFASC